MMTKQNTSTKTAVVIPCYKVKSKIIGVIQKIGTEVDSIIIVDDACPEKSGEFVRTHLTDERLKFIFHTENKGVGGAMASGFKLALQMNMDFIVKIDGDGQMNPELIPKFIQPLIEKRADYVKGNRFFNLYSLAGMPTIRLIGNASLSFMAKLLQDIIKQWTPPMDISL